MPHIHEPPNLQGEGVLIAGPRPVPAALRSQARRARHVLHIGRKPSLGP
jgi:hypothetical protein